MRLRARLALGMGAILLVATLIGWAANALLLEPVFRWQRDAEVSSLVRTLVAQPFAESRMREVLAERDPEQQYSVYVVDAGLRQIFTSAPPHPEPPQTPLNPPPNGQDGPPPSPPPVKPKPFYPQSEFRDLRPGQVELMTKAEPGLGGNFLLGLGRFSGGESLVASAPLSGIRESARTASLFLALTTLVVLVPALLLVVWLSARITRPLEELSDYTRQLGGLDFRPAPRVKGAVEVVQLGSHIQSMAESVAGEMDRRTALDETRREFFSNASHELKTPLTLIQGYAEGLLEGIADSPAKRDEYLAVILEEVKHMDRHLRDLLDLSRWESGARVPDWEELEVGELVRTCVERFESRWSPGDVVVEAPELLVTADRAGVDQILSNYLTNALDHGAERPRIGIRLSSTAATWRLEVFNAGPLLPAGEEERIWLSYYKADKSRVRGFGGSGLGLAIVKGIVATHAGTCGAENRLSEPQGVCFWVELPLVPASL